MRIALVNMPFARLNAPSLALAQLASRLTGVRGDLSVRVLDLNHEFGAALGVEFYDYVVDQYTNGLGDWLFRRAAFPDLEDNADAYLARYYPGRRAESAALRTRILGARDRVEDTIGHVVQRHALAEYDVVGFTSMFTQSVASFALARALKERNPAIVTVMGGANCESPMGEEIARYVHYIDFVFSGPALVSFPQFVGQLMRGLRPRHLEIDGVLCQQSADDEPRAAARPLGRDLPISVPVAIDYRPFIDSYHEHFEGANARITLPFETSRGCWWGERSHCTFCGLNGSSMAYRAMEPSAALAQFDALLHEFPDCKRLFAVDNIMPRDYVQTVFPHLRPPDDVTIFYEVKADLDDAELGAMARAGVRRVQPGIESLNTGTLKLMRKGTSVFQNVRFLMGCKRHDINPIWNLLVGFPGESAEVFEKYVDDMPGLNHLPPPTGAYTVRFDRYSPYFMHADAYGLRLTPLDFYRLTYPFPEESLSGLAYYFADTVLGDYFEGMLEWLPRVNEGVAAWRAAWARGARLRWGDRRPGEQVVLDSRTGAAERPLRLTDLQGRVLDACREPGSPGRLAERIEGLTEDELLETVAALRSQRLVIEESGRVMSLVEAG
jgi:magnesium-protoporphyrin IX monomethyl ester (oxidative) cyclase